MLWRNRVLPVIAHLKDLFHISKNLKTAINQKTLLNQSRDLVLYYFICTLKKTQTKPHNKKPNQKPPQMTTYKPFLNSGT